MYQSFSKEFPFKKALSEEDISIIAEVKRASPSKGLIVDDFDYIKIAKDYELAGASAISVLTEPYFFMGSNEYLSSISKNVNIPLLRKDFIIDEYMIWEAKLIGASAILLIVSILDIVQLKKFLDFWLDLIPRLCDLAVHTGPKIRHKESFVKNIIPNAKDFVYFIHKTKGHNPQKTPRRSGV